jgi:5-methyltetrahydropteroyltriglutamate--homocysteine methyltransferase
VITAPPSYRGNAEAVLAANDQHERDRTTASRILPTGSTFGANTAMPASLARKIRVAVVTFVERNGAVIGPPGHSLYDEIHRAGFVLPRPGRPRHRHGESLEEFRHRAALHIEAINHATRDIPTDALRLHGCWGNYEGPHTKHVPLADIIDLLFRARPRAISFEAANPRHGCPTAEC